jgi:hypothetical protein
VNTTFQSRSLSEIADVLAEYYGMDRNTFYDKTARWFEGRIAKAVKVPLSQAPLEDYGKIEKEKGKPPGSGPPPPTSKDLTNLTKPNQGMVRRETEDGIGVSSIPNRLTEKSDTPHEGYNDKNAPWGNNENSGYVVRKIVKNEDNKENNDLTNDLTKPNHWLGNDDEFLNSLDKVKDFLSEFELHGRIDKNGGMAIIDLAPYSEVAHWVNEKIQPLGFEPVESPDGTKMVFRYREVAK